MSAPPFTGDLRTWARQATAYLNRTASKFLFKTADDTPSENGIVRWDEANGYPVVAKGGVWEPIILEDAMSFDIRQAERVVFSTYGDTVSVKDKAKNLLKFGRNASVGTSSVTVWDLNQNETFVTTNAVDTISSSDAGDTAVIFVEGHTVSGTGASAEFTFVTQTATLNGQNKVTLTTPLARCSRMFVQSGTIAGDVYVYEDTSLTAGVPSDLTKVKCNILGATGFTQSFKVASTISNSDYYIVTGGYASVNKKTTASVDLTFEVRQVGGVFRPAGGRISLSSAGQNTVQIKFEPYVIIPKNSDFRVVAEASTTGVSVDASIQGYLAQVVT